MGIFSKPETIILKESNNAKDYLKKLQDLLPRATGETIEKIEKEIAIVNAGIYGEESILYELKNSGLNLVILHDLYIKTNSGLTAQIDYIILTPKYFYVLECKNLVGNIEINNNGDFIRTLQYGTKKYKEGIYSPITQNERHLTVLKEYRSENSNLLMRAIKNATFNDLFKGIVVLANSKTLINDKYAKKEVKEKVIRTDRLISYIKETNNKSKGIPISLKELVNIGKRYLDMNIDNRPNYFEKYELLVQEVESSSNSQNEVLDNNKENSLICPKCGEKLILRIAKKGEHAGNQFYGCSNYPKCRFIQNC